MGWVAPVVGAAASVLSTAMTNSANNASNKASREWSTMMSNTEMQRRVADLKAAGLNPMLAVNGGGSGATYSTPNVLPMQAPDFERGASTAMQAYMARSNKTAVELQNANLQKTGDNIDANTAKAMAEAQQAQSAARVNDVTVGKVVADTEFTSTSSVNAKNQYNVLNAERAKLNAEAQEIASRNQGNVLDNQQKAALMPIIQQMNELELRRMNLSMPRLENESNAQDSWWMKKISPYLPDILKSAGAGAAAGSTYKAFK